MGARQATAPVGLVATVASLALVLATASQAGTAEVTLGAAGSGSDRVTLLGSSGARGDELCLRAKRAVSQRRGDISCFSDPASAPGGLRASAAVLDCRTAVAYGTVSERASRLTVTWSSHRRSAARLLALPASAGHGSLKAFVAVRRGRTTPTAVAAYTSTGRRLARARVAPSDASEVC